MLSISHNRYYIFPLLSPSFLCLSHNYVRVFQKSVVFDKITKTFEKIWNKWVLPFGRLKLKPHCDISIDN